jgi:hypothetical protein
MIPSFVSLFRIPAIFLFKDEVPGRLSRCARSINVGGIIACTSKANTPAKKYYPEVNAMNPPKK